MLRKILLGMVSSFILCSVNAQALTLEQSVVEVLNTNPIVTERLRNYRATQQDLNIAESKFLPSIDFRSAISHHEAGNFNDRVRDSSFDYYENSLKLTQNLFDGFHTTHQVDYEEARILAAAYNYLEKANDVSFQMVSVYLNVLKAQELLENAKESVDVSKRLLADMEDLYDSRMVTKSDLIKVQASLAMAKTNLITRINNEKDAGFNFARILGRKPIPSEMTLPSLKVSMPESIQRATMYAIKNNPSLLVSQYNIEGAQALYKRDKNNYYPKIDLELEQFYNDAFEMNNGFESPDDRSIIRLVFNWNLYNGNADEALVQKKLSKINQEVAIKRDLKRQTIEGLELSWSAYEIVSEQIKQLGVYQSYMESTLDSLEKEYRLGTRSRRTILDLLGANTDVVNSKAKMISASYDNLFAQYRILDAMGLMVTVVAGDAKEYRSRVNIDVEEVKETLDVLPIKLDTDDDKIADGLDICDNSVDKYLIMPYGCVKTIADSDFDGVRDSLDRCINTELGSRVDKDGCSTQAAGK